MRKVAATFSVLVSLDRSVAAPLHRQIYEAFVAKIADGILRRGQQLPSTRALAAELSISRIPVLNAYSQLIAEGYFETCSGIGTFVARELPQSSSPRVYANGSPSKSASTPALLSKFCSRESMAGAAPWLYGFGAFSAARVTLEQFPSRIWSKLIAHHASVISDSDPRFTDPMGLRPLREVIATYLKSTRAVKCDAEQIMLVDGRHQALTVTSQVLFDRGSPVWVEEPGCPAARQVFTMAGCDLVAVPLDNEGICVARGAELCERPRAAYVTPSHQFPMGVTMTVARRQQLLDWAHRLGSWIIEDDWGCEFRYEGMPVASLQGLDTNARVIYIGTFGRNLFPSLRLAYVVIPRDLVKYFVAARQSLDLYPASLFQAVLTDFIQEGHFGRHIRRMRRIYGQQREALREGLKDEFRPPLEVSAGEAGTHVVAFLPNGIADRELSLQAARQKLWLAPLSSCYLGNPRQGFILGFGSASSSDLKAALSELRRLVRGTRGSGSSHEESLPELHQLLSCNGPVRVLG
ncbi:MAG: PLP-dependent aminotransferase family protein [Acidobacteria bacterium]|nr:MAG: PLP-dependent aminotransferase family protein [Acidobacteriota bacterium]